METKDNKERETGYTLLITETYRLGIKGAENYEQAKEVWDNGEEDRYVYGKIYEDVVEGLEDCSECKERTETEGMGKW
tara:strand:+ start:319 stop:552 length:234 start_codon:yes stop_codon:yes gene_type:complete